MNRPKVSIIINNYNYARFLHACIDSAITQTYTNIEVIAVDDGSSDNSASVLESRSDSVQIILQANAGQGSAFNTGFAASTGDLILFLDSDDLLMPNAIQVVADSWRSEFSKLQFPLQVIDTGGFSQGLTVPRGRLSRGNVRHEILNEGSYRTPPTSGNVYSRSLLEAVMPMPASQWRKAADMYLNTYAGFHGEIGACDTPLGMYRVHGSSLSTVVLGETVQLEQVHYLLRLHDQMQNLVEQTARTHGVVPRRNLMMSNLSHLKLLLTLSRMSGERGFIRVGATVKVACSTIFCALRAKRNSLSSRIQMALWALAVTLAPRRVAIHLIKLAFDLSPKSRFIAALRRA